MPARLSVFLPFCLVCTTMVQALVVEMAVVSGGGWVDLDWCSIFLYEGGLCNVGNGSRCLFCCQMAAHEIGAWVGHGIHGLFYSKRYHHNNNYLDSQPDYDKTVTHTEFDDLLSATTKGQDVSTMERVYRWVAGGHMIADKPALGFGPGTFTKYYKSYTIFGFNTYVSDNWELSGIHCYYLMTAVEQGIIGALLFLALIFLVLLKGEQVYHQTKSVGRRRVVMMAILATVVIDGLLLMNDLVETDKVGSFFFLCMALIRECGFGE